MNTRHWILACLVGIFTQLPVHEAQAQTITYNWADSSSYATLNNSPPPTGFRCRLNVQNLAYDTFYKTNNSVTVNASTLGKITTRIQCPYGSYVGGTAVCPPATRTVVQLDQSNHTQNGTCKNAIYNANGKLHVATGCPWGGGGDLVSLSINSSGVASAVVSGNVYEVNLNAQTNTAPACVAFDAGGGCGAGCGG
jgi:hypothetical protein